MENNSIANKFSRLATRFKLSNYELSIYLTVLQHGKLTASEISEKAGVPQPRVYDTTRDLADQGLIELRDSRPIEALAINPEKTFEDTSSRLQELITDLNKKYEAPSRETEAVALISSRQTILRYLEEIIDQAEYELALSLTPEILAQFEDALKSKVDSNVIVDLLVSPSAELPSADEYDYAQVSTIARKRRGVTTPMVAVADGSYSMFTTRTALQTNDEYGVIFNRSELGFLVLGFLNTVIWPSSATLNKSEPDSLFPRRYATVRRCVRDIKDSDHALYATVRGRDVETGDYCQVSGKVIKSTLGRNNETAAITLDTENKQLDIGGQVATFEDIEAHQIAVGLKSPPKLLK